MASDALQYDVFLFSGILYVLFSVSIPYPRYAQAFPSIPGILGTVSGMPSRLCSLPFNFYGQLLDYIRDGRCGGIRNPCLQRKLKSFGTKVESRLGKPRERIRIPSRNISAGRSRLYNSLKLIFRVPTGLYSATVSISIFHCHRLLAAQCFPFCGGSIG